MHATDPPGRGHPSKERTAGGSSRLGIYNEPSRELPLVGRGGGCERRWLSRPAPAPPQPAGPSGTRCWPPSCTSPHPGFLSRPRLLERLVEGATRGLTLGCAPAGFGKTSLLGDWPRRGQPAVVWLSLDAGDNDPVR